MIKLVQFLLIFLSLNTLEVFGQEAVSKDKTQLVLNFAGNYKYKAAEDLPYERFIGLGNCCLTRYQINNHLSQRFGMDASSFGGGQLFDWLLIHDYHLLAEAIENNLSDLLEKSDLVLGPTWLGPHYPSIKNIRYNMTWNHLFTRQSDASIVPNILDLEYAIKKQKIDYLIEKFKFLKHYRTLYIVAYPFTEQDGTGTIEPDQAAIFHLCNALKKLRGNNNFTLLFCPLRPTFEDFENICVRPIVNSPYTPFFIGDCDCWNAILSQFPFTLDKVERDGSQLDDTF